MRKRAKKTMLAYFVSASLFPVMAMDLSEERPDRQKQPKVTGEHTAKTDFLQKVYEHGKFQEPNPNRNFQIFRTNVNSWMQENAKHPAFHEDLTNNLEMSLRRLTQNYYQLDHQKANDDTVNPLKFMGIFSSYWKQLDKTGHLKNLPIDLIASSMKFADRMLLDNLKFYSEKCQGNVCAFSRETGLIDPESNDDLKNSQSYQDFYRNAYHNFEMLRLDTVISLIKHPHENRLAHSTSQNLDRDTLISNSLSQKPEQNHLSLSSVLNLDEKESPLQEIKGVKFIDRDFFDVIEEFPIQKQIQTLFAQIESLSNSFSGQEGTYLKFRGEIQSAIHDLDEKFRSQLPAQMIRSSSFRTAGMKVPDDLKLMAILSEYVNKMDEIYGIKENKINEILKKDPDVSNCYFNFEIKPGEYASGFTYQFGMRNPEMYPELKQSQDYMDLYTAVSQQLTPLMDTAKRHIQGQNKTTTSSLSESRKEDHTSISPKQTETPLIITPSQNSSEDTSKKGVTSSLSLTALKESTAQDDPTRKARHNPIFLNQVIEKLRENGSNEALLQLADNIGSWVNNPDSQKDFYQNLMNNISYSISKLYLDYFQGERMEKSEVSDYLKLIAGLRDYAVKVNNMIPSQLRSSYIPEDVIKSTDHLLLRQPVSKEDWGRGRTIDNPYFYFNNEIAFSPEKGLLNPEFQTGLGANENYRTFYQAVDKQLSPLVHKAFTNIVIESLKAHKEITNKEEAAIEQQPKPISETISTQSIQTPQPDILIKQQPVLEVTTDQQLVTKSDKTEERHSQPLLTPRQKEIPISLTVSQKSEDDTSKKEVTSSLNLSPLQESSAQEDPTREARHNPIFLNQVIEKLRENGSNEALLQLADNIGSWVNNPDSQKDFYQNLMNNISYSISKLYFSYFSERIENNKVSDYLKLIAGLRDYATKVNNRIPQQYRTANIPNDVIISTNHLLWRGANFEENWGNGKTISNPYFRFNNTIAFSSVEGLIDPDSNTKLGKSENYRTFYQLVHQQFHPLEMTAWKNIIMEWLNAPEQKRVRETLEKQQPMGDTPQPQLAGEEVVEQPILKAVNNPQPELVAERIIEQQPIPKAVNNPQPELVVERIVDQQPIPEAVNNPQPELVVEQIVDQQPIPEAVNNPQPELVVEQIVDQQPIPEAVNNPQPELVVEQIVDQQPIREEAIDQQPKPIVEQIVDQQPIREEAIDQQPKPIVEQIVDQQPIREEAIDQQPKPIVEQIVDQQPIREEAIDQQPELVVEQIVDQQPIREEAIDQQPKPIVEQIVDQQPIREEAIDQQPKPIVEQIVDQQPIREEAIDQQPELVVEQIVDQQPIREEAIDQQPKPIVEQIVDQQPIREEAIDQQPKPIVEQIVDQQPIREEAIDQQPKPIVEQIVDQQPIREEAIDQQPKPIVEQIVDQQPIREEAIDQHLNNLNAAHNMVHLVPDIDAVNPEQNSATLPQGIAEKSAPASSLNESSFVSPAIFLGSSGGKVSDTNKASPEKPEKMGVLKEFLNKILPANPPLGVGGLGLKKIFMQQTKDLKAQENSKKNTGKTPNKGDANNKAPISAFDCNSKEGLERAKTALKDKGVQSISLRQIKKDDLNNLWPHMNNLVKLDIEFHKAEDVLGRKPLPNLRQLSLSIKDGSSMAKMHAVVALFPNLSTLVVDHKAESSPSNKIKMTQEIAKKWPNLISVSVI